MVPTIALGVLMLITWAAAVWASYQEDEPAVGGPTIQEAGEVRTLKRAA
jgi:hypothetical protein